jgi:[ribosomal protein S5]-alanine N-acetyltransferase
MLEMPVLTTERLMIRPFIMADLTDVYQLLDVDLDAATLGTDKVESLAERAEWLQWAIMNPTQLAKLHQPPYGDRAIVLRSNAKLIGACGYVPCLNFFEQVPGLASEIVASGMSHNTTEFGLFYAISPAYQRQGFASEAAQALVDYAFRHLQVKRIIAETDYDNAGSVGVMRKLGMQIEKNVFAEPPWLQIVGVLENTTRYR